MRLQKEEKIALILLLMALSSLAIAAWAFSGSEQESVQSTATAKDSSVSVEGIVLEMNPTKSGGNLLIRLDSTPAAIFVPQDSGAKDVMSKVKIGNKIEVKGRPTEFQGAEEIKVDRVKDIEIVASDEE